VDAHGAALVLVVNAGSSSLKLRLVDGDDRVAGRVDLPPIGDLADGDLPRALDGLGACDAVGHRIVHGGRRFVEPVVVDAEVRARLGAISGLAPLHQAAALEALDAVSAALPAVPAVACFDTAFHATLPPEAATYPVPEAWREHFGVRRFGFHGLSHAHASRRAAEMARERGARSDRVVTCHLGAGASLAAVRAGRSVDTTMGFTPLEGLAMATRSGSVDPGALLWLLDHQNLAVAEVADALERRSGLAGLAGTGDMSAVVARAAAGDGAAELALAVYLHRLRAGIAAMAASLGGLDVLVFTGGVGENAAAVRAAAAAGVAFLGVAIDAEANRVVDVGAGHDADISAGDAAARTLVVAAREELEIARGVRARLA
jgi:acetate kinase